MQRGNNARSIAEIVEELRAHPESEHAQRNGCAAFADFARSGASNRSQIADAGGIEAVVAALRAHPESEAVQKNGCDALAWCALNDAIRVRIADGHLDGFNDVWNCSTNFLGGYWY